MTTLRIDHLARTAGLVAWCGSWRDYHGPMTRGQDADARASLDRGGCRCCPEVGRRPA